MSGRYDEEEEERIRECTESSCGHFDLINQCCWQSGRWGLCFDVEEGDSCRLGYKEDDDR